MGKIVRQLLCHTSCLIAVSIIVLLCSHSCSTIKHVPDGSYRLTANVVNVTNANEHPEFSNSEVQNYIRQKTNSYVITGKTGGWNPALYIYNWDNGKGKKWDNFVHKLGNEPVIYDSTLVDDSKENILNHLRFLGYYHSSVEVSLHKKKGKKKAYMVYSVTLGKRIPIRCVSYEVSDSMLACEYMADSAAFLIRKGMYLSEKLLDSESERATKVFKNKGYYDFTKNSFFFEADTLEVPDSASVLVQIRNYTRNETPKDAEPHRKYTFGEVRVYPVSDAGMYRASLSTKIPLDYDTVKFGDITIFYDKKRKMRPAVLNRMNQMKPGTFYSDDIVSNTYSRFSNLRCYSSVTIDLNKSAEPGKVDADIVLIPAKVNGYKINLEASTNSTGLIGISPAISYLNKNIFHGGEWLSVSFMGNFQFMYNDVSTRATEVGASAGLSFPKFVFLPDRYFKKVLPRTSVNVNYNLQIRPEYKRNMIGGNFGYNWNTKSEKHHYDVLPFRLNVVHMSDVSEGFIESQKDPFVRETYKSHFELGMGFIWNYMSVPSLNPDRSNLKTSFSFDIAGNLLSAFNSLMPQDTNGARTIWGTPYSQFIRYEASLTYTWKFGKNNRQALAIRLLQGMGYAYGNSSTVPFERLFWAGGANSMRGWQARALGPGTAPLDTTFSIPNQTGDFRLEANIEYRFPIFWKLFGAVFLDWGNVWNVDFNNKLEADNPGKLKLDRLFQTAGFNTGLGLRLDFNFVVVRVDWGVRLYDPAVQRWKYGSTFQFSIGYPF